MRGPDKYIKDLNGLPIVLIIGTLLCLLACLFPHEWLAQLANESLHPRPACLSLNTHQAGPYPLLLRQLLIIEGSPIHARHFHVLIVEYGAEILDEEVQVTLLLLGLNKLAESHDLRSHRPLLLIVCVDLAQVFLPLAPILLCKLLHVNIDGGFLLTLLVLREKLFEVLV